MNRLDEVFVEQIWWYTSRAAGVVAWVLLTLSVLAGLMISSRTSRNLPAGWTLDLHRFLSMLSLLFLTIHMAALVPDNFVYFSWAELLVPFASDWDPAAVAWGVVAFWMLVTVEATSLLRSRIPKRAWRTIHLTSFIVWAFSTIHLLEAGTDASHVAFRAAQVVAVVAVVALTTYRIIAARRRRRSGPLSIEEPVHVDEIDPGERGELATRRR